MNSSRRSTPLHDAAPNVGIPSPRIRKLRSFTILSDKLNALREEFAIVRETVDGVMNVLDAQAGLVMLPPPVDLLYSKHRDHSEPLARLERTLRDRGDAVMTMFSLDPQKRILEFEGLMLLPLTWQNSTIGLLALDREEKRLTPHHEAGLLSLCNQLAAIIGLRHQPLQPASQGKHMFRQRDVEQAIVLQKSLLPSVPSSSCGLSIATYAQAAEYVSGDYFDLVLVDQSKMGIVIADVEGKGVSAALFGNLLRTTVHFLTRESPSTAAVVGKINTILHKETTSAHKLFTLFYAIYDAKTKILTYTGSGHVNPIVIRAGGSLPERLLSEGAPMGIAPKQRFHERSVQLHEGDLVAYFTDGVSDCANERGELFGEERLIQLLKELRKKPVENVLQAVVSALEQFASPPLADDRTIILTSIL